MRLYNKAKETITIKYGGDEHKFGPGGPVHFTDYDLAQCLLRRNANLVDYDIWIAAIETAEKSGNKSEAEALKKPVVKGFQLPGLDEPHSTWLARAQSLGMKDAGRFTSKLALIKFCKDALGTPEGAPVPPFIVEQEKNRIAELWANVDMAKAMSNAGIEP